jgi:hypothetical protein
MISVFSDQYVARGSAITYHLLLSSGVLGSSSYLLDQENGMPSAIHFGFLEQMEVPFSFVTDQKYFR